MNFNYTMVMFLYARVVKLEDVLYGITKYHLVFFKKHYTEFDAKKILFYQTI